MFVPQHIDAFKARHPQHVLVQRDAAGPIEMIIINEATARLQEPAYPFIARSDLAHVLQIVNCNAGDDKVEWPANHFHPFRILQVAYGVANLFAAIPETRAGVSEHRRRKVLQHDPGAWKCPQERIGDSACACPNVEHGEFRIRTKWHGCNQPVYDRLAFSLATRIVFNPVTDIVF